MKMVESMEDKIAILLVDDHDMVRAGLKTLLNQWPDMAVVADVASGKEAVETAVRLNPDIALVDISMPDMDGLEVVGQLKTLSPQTRAIVLSMHEEEHFVVQALDQGALGYVTKRSAPEDLAKAVRKVFMGGRFLSDKASELLAVRVSLDPRNLSPLALLSTREKQVLRRLARGKPARKIAEEYDLSIKTVNTYRARLLQKLGLQNNVELALFAVRNRLIEP